MHWAWLFLFTGSKLHIKKLKFSNDETKLEWMSPFWARKEGIIFMHVKEVVRGIPGAASRSKEELLRTITVITQERPFSFEVKDEHAREAMIRFLVRRSHYNSTPIKAA